MNPKISIIVPLYNKENAIRQTIQSVLDQSFKDYELLIVDDGSTDNSLAVVRSFNDKRIRLVSKTNGGVSDARNFGIKNAKSDYIFLLDADDTITKNCLSILNKLTLDYQNEFVFSANFILRSSDNKENVFCRGKNEELISKTLKAIWTRKAYPRTGSMLIKKQCFEQVGYFRTDISVFEDLEFTIRLAKQYHIAYSPKIIMTYVTEHNALSKSHLHLSKEFAYYISIRNKSFYEQVILAENLFQTYQKRKRIEDNEALKYLKINYKKYILLICFARLVKRLINLYYRVFNSHNKQKNYRNY